MTSAFVRRGCRLHPVTEHLYDRYLTDPLNIANSSRFYGAYFEDLAPDGITVVQPLAPAPDRAPHIDREELQLIHTISRRIYLSGLVCTAGRLAVNDSHLAANMAPADYASGSALLTNQTICFLGCVDWLHVQDSRTGGGGYIIRGGYTTVTDWIDVRTHHYHPIRDAAKVAEMLQALYDYHLSRGNFD